MLYCESSGFSSNQAESVVHALVQITEATLDHMNKNMVTKAQQVIVVVYLYTCVYVCVYVCRYVSGCVYVCVCVWSYLNMN